MTADPKDAQNHDTGDTHQGDHDTAGEGAEKSGVAKEIGGRDGPDPTRFGDWEKNGRCIDF